MSQSALVRQAVTACRCAHQTSEELREKGLSREAEALDVFRHEVAKLAILASTNGSAEAVAALTTALDWYFDLPLGAAVAGHAVTLGLQALLG